MRVSVYGGQRSIRIHRDTQNWQVLVGLHHWDPFANLNEATATINVFLKTGARRLL